MQSILTVGKTTIFLVALLLLSASPLCPQEPRDESEENPLIGIEDEDQQAIDDDQLFVIADFEFDIKGRTRGFALIYNGELKRGEEIRGRANLEAYVQEKTQMLVNQRVLKDNVEITYSVGEQQPDGAYPVTLAIKVEDSWNIIVIPIPRYSDNTGLEIVLRGRDYNFLGTMNPLLIDLTYGYDQNRRHSFSIGVDSNTPFRAFGYDWNFQFLNLFSYRPQVEEPFERFFFQNRTGLSMELPFRATTFTFGFEESVNLNEENEERHKLSTGLGKHPDFQSGLYLSSKLYTSWEIPTGLLVSRFGELTYTPEISAKFNHELPNWPLQDIHKGPFLNFGHTLGFERIDWHANFRKGLSVSVGNSYEYDFFRQQNGKDPLSIDITVTGIGHFIITSFFGISSRIQYRHWFYHDPGFYDQAGDNIRGIRDRELTADYMLSLNANFPLRLPTFSPATWFNNRKLRGLDIEFHFSPLIDLALYHTPKTETSSEISFSLENIAVGGGFEVMVFPLIMRNLYIRLSFTWNLREFSSGDNREFTFIMGHFF
ncbi:MAG: hypothetical protein LBQ69_06410 [Treponema sp.]|jgi:hypothetical protein|nr:hypothetical protein [Treponema sp.]